MISTRRPRAEEAGAFAELHVRCWRETYPGIIPPGLMASFSIETRLPLWQAALADPDRFVLGAFSDGAAAGFVMSGPSEEAFVDAQDGHLAAIYIARTHHRRGIGRQLLRAAAQDWRNRGGHTMTIGVLAENFAARKFYESLGARLVKHGVYNWDGYDLADCIYLMDDLAGLA